MSVLIARIIASPHLTLAGERAVKLRVATPSGRHQFAIGPREAKRLAAELVLLARDAEASSLPAPSGSSSRS